jgi:hypothetical protein
MQPPRRCAKRTFRPIKIHHDPRGNMMTAQLITPSSTSNVHKFTVQQYELMLEAGVFAEGDCLELINGD